MSIPEPPFANGRIAVEHVAGSDGSTCVVVSLIGEFDMSNAHDLRDQLGTALDGSPAAVVLDLEALDFSDSTTLGLLVAAHRRAQAVGAELRLAKPPRFMQRLVKITNLDTVLKVYPDLDAAKPY